MSAALLALRQTVSRRLPLRPWRRLAGAAITGSGLVLLLLSLAQSLAALPGAVQAALAVTLGTALATGAGALPVLVLRRITARQNAALLGVGAGVMLAATAFSLVLPGLEAAQATFAGLGVPLFAMAVVTGGALLMALDRLLPHSHFSSGPVVSHAGHARLARRVRGVWLFVMAIGLHNLPEGLAVGVSVGAGDAGAAALSLGIALQNLPEGLVVAMALAGLGYRPGQATLVALATGLLEPVGGLLGATLVQGAAAWLPLGLGLAAGAMLYAVCHEVIPEAHRGGHETAATSGLLLGFAVMIALDASLT
ncbi:MAG: ZIP family metal transporter [Moraxellaceae bacterium]